MLNNLFSFFFLAMDPMAELDAAARSSFRLDATDTFIVLGAAVVLVGLIVLWAVFFRRRPTEKNGASSLSSFSTRRGKSRRRSSSGSHSSKSPGSSTEGSSQARPRRPEPVGDSSEGVSASGRRIVRRRSSKRREDLVEPAKFEDVDPKRMKVRKRRRRHHPDNYPRNPTLDEVGGLPPLRAEDPAPEGEETKDKATD